MIHVIKELGDQQGLDDIRFQQGADREGKRYSNFLKNNTAHIDDIHDAEEIAKAMMDLLDRFQPHLEAVGKMLRGFVSQLQ